MANNLVIVESPAKAKTIGKFLGKSYKIIASMGHVRDLPKSQIGVDVANNFEPKYITIRGKGDIVAGLKKEAKKAKNVFLATDPDREGEAISWHIAALLGIEDKKKCRITFNEITQKAVKEAIKGSREINMNLVDAQQARRILDRLVGYKISPLLWKKVKKGLSAGRVQSVATKLICDRENEIDNFVTEEYWHLDAYVTKQKDDKEFKIRFYGDSKKIELKDESTVNSIKEEIKKSDFIIDKIVKKEAIKEPPAPFITSTLQQEASRKMGFTARKTMMIAQQLYEGINIKGRGSTGLVTYIRTDSRRIADEAYEGAKEIITKCYGKDYLPNKRRVYKNKSSSQDAHEAIRPSYLDLAPEAIKDSLSRDQLRLYRMIWERFFGSQMAAAVYDTVSINVKADNYIFKAKGSTLKFEGFLKAQTKTRKKKNDEDENGNGNGNEKVELPELMEKEILNLIKLDGTQNFTQPPSRYTEASLIRTLEEKGIGRPSTYAPTLATILARGYVFLEKKQIHPTELGKIVNDIMVKHFKKIINIKFTADMEKKLDNIEEGGYEWVHTIGEFYKDFEKAFLAAEEEIGDIELPVEESDVECEKCGRMMVYKLGRYGKFLACPGFPECRNTKAIVEETGAKCPKCDNDVVIRRSRKGKKYLGCNGYPDCDFMSWNLPSGKDCPVCGSFLGERYFGRKKTLICSKEGCEYNDKDNNTKEEKEKEVKKEAEVK
jgi:DNA topoisomerase-1